MTNKMTCRGLRFINSYMHYVFITDLGFSDVVGISWNKRRDSNAIELNDR